MKKCAAKVIGAVWNGLASRPFGGGIIEGQVGEGVGNSMEESLAHNGAAKILLAAQRLLMVDAWSGHLGIANSKWSAINRVHGTFRKAIKDTVTK